MSIYNITKRRLPSGRRASDRLVWSRLSTHRIINIILCVITIIMSFLSNSLIDIRISPGGSGLSQVGHVVTNVTNPEVKP